MNRTSRFAAAAVAAALSFGVSGPAVAAGHDDLRSHHASQSDESRQSGKPGRNGTTEAKFLKQVLNDVAHLDRALSKVAKMARGRGLTAEDQAALNANIAADRDNLKMLATAALSADTNTDLKQVRDDLKALRVENYGQAVNSLRLAARLAERVDEDRSGVEDGTDEAAALDEATTLLAEAVEQARSVTASSDKSEMRALKSALGDAKQQCEDVKDLYDDNGTDDNADDNGTDDNGTDDDHADDDNADDDHGGRDDHGGHGGHGGHDD